MTASWTAPLLWTNTLVVTETHMNTHIRDNLEYLKGVLGSGSAEGTDLQNVYLNTAKALGVGTAFYMSLVAGNPTLTFDANDYIVYNRTTNTYNFIIGGATKGWFSATLMPLRTVTPSLHLESGTSAAESVGASSNDTDIFAFTVAFASAPAVTTGFLASAVQVNIRVAVTTLSTTGVTLTKYNTDAGSASTITTYYLAVGAD